jgi:F0F1-type ATP synthase assembly protein I
MLRAFTPEAARAHRSFAEPESGWPKMPPEREDNGDAERRSLWIQIARYSQLALVLPAATLVGWLIGVGLDRWLHTTWLYLLGLIVGIAAGFIELIRTVTSSEARE